jgi:hypothetical protein
MIRKFQKDNWNIIIAICESAYIWQAISDLLSYLSVKSCCRVDSPT